MYEVLVCVWLLWHDHSGLGEAGRGRPVELRGDESARTEDIWTFDQRTDGPLAAVKHLSIFSPGCPRTCNTRLIL